MEATDIPQALIARCRQRDRQAYQQLVSLLMRPAYFQALALMGNADDALDVSQDALARVWTHLHAYDSAQPFYPWFYTVLRHLALNALRSRRRRAEVGGEEADNWLESRESTADRPEQVAAGDQLSRTLTAALNALSPADREIITLKEMHDCSYKDIAELLGIPLGTVMSRLYTARTRLRAALEERGYEHTTD